MVSFVILSKDPQLGIDYVLSQYSNLGISPFDQLILSKTSGEKPTSQSIGIDQIKQLQKKLYLKPLQSENKAVMIQNAEVLTLEAQNALLKMLEEPPPHTYIYLLAKQRSDLLPTILSRCKIIRIETQEAANQTKTAEIHQLLHDLPKSSCGERLKLAETVSKQKQTAIEWLEQLLYTVLEAIQQATKEKDQTTLPFLVHLAESSQDTLHNIQTTNVNVRLAIENLLLSL